MKLLVTGGAGFIGSNFVDSILQCELAERLTVFDSLTYAADPQKMALLSERHRNFSFVHADICNVVELDFAVSQATHIVHFAAETHVTRSIADNDIFFQTDVIGTKNLVQSIARNANNIEKFIHISTSEVYGDALEPFMNENHSLNPKSPYAAAKLAADRLVYAFIQTYNIPALIVRPFNQYGPRQHVEKVIPRFITSSILGEPLTIHGDGLSHRDYLHVEDLINFLKTALVNQVSVPNHVVNIGSGKGVSILEIARFIMELFPNKIDLHHVSNRPGQVVRHTADFTQAKKLFDWQPKIVLKTGLEETVNWYSRNKSFWEPQLWTKKIKIVLPSGNIEEQ